MNYKSNFVLEDTLRVTADGLLPSLLKITEDFISEIKDTVWIRLHAVSTTLTDIWEETELLFQKKINFTTY